MKSVFFFFNQSHGEHVSCKKDDGREKTLFIGYYTSHGQATKNNQPISNRQMYFQTVQIIFFWMVWYATSITVKHCQFRDDSISIKTVKIVSKRPSSELARRAEYFNTLDDLVTTLIFNHCDSWSTSSFLFEQSSAQKWVWKKLDFSHFHGQKTYFQISMSMYFPRSLNDVEFFKFGPLIGSIFNTAKFWAPTQKLVLCKLQKHKRLTSVHHQKQ